MVSEASTQIMTTPGLVLGTVQYMSPEQALGREVDYRSDIFSLGVVLYEMATGRLPFSGKTSTEIIDRIAHIEPDAIARFNYSVPIALERIIRKCLEKARERRYLSASELVIDLKSLQGADNAGGGVMAQSRRNRFRKSTNSLAVLPLVNVSADPNMEYLSVLRRALSTVSRKSQAYASWRAALLSATRAGRLIRRRLDVSGPHIPRSSVGPEIRKPFTAHWSSGVGRRP